MATITAVLTYELVVKGMSNKAYRFAMGLAVATVLVLSCVNFVLAIDVSLAIFMHFGESRHCANRPSFGHCRSHRGAFVGNAINSSGSA